MEKVYSTIKGPVKLNLNELNSFHEIVEKLNIAMQLNHKELETDLLHQGMIVLEKREREIKIIQEQIKAENEKISAVITPEKERELKALTLGQMRNILFSQEWTPKHLQAYMMTTKVLLMKAEEMCQQMEILEQYRKQDAAMGTRMSMITKQAEMLEVERNCLNQVIRIFASQGRIDPSAEDQIG